MRSSVLDLNDAATQSVIEPQVTERLKPCCFQTPQGSSSAAVCPLERRSCIAPRFKIRPSENQHSTDIIFFLSTLTEKPELGGQLSDQAAIGRENQAGCDFPIKTCLIYRTCASFSLLLHFIRRIYTDYASISPGA